MGDGASFPARQQAAIAAFAGDTGPRRSRNTAPVHVAVLLGYRMNSKTVSFPSAPRRLGITGWTS